MSRFQPVDPLSSFSQATSTNNLNYLTSITLKYNSVGPTGFTFVYNDGTQVNVGYSGTQSASLDLTGSKKLYSFKSYCGTLICKTFQLCSIDTLSLQTTCITGGNTSTHFNTGISVLNLQILSFYGTFNTYNGSNYFSNLANTYSLLDKSSNNRVDLIKVATTSISNFSQAFYQAGSITINYNSVCVTGLKFDFSDGTMVSTGYTGSNSMFFDLSNQKKIYSISTNYDKVCKVVRLCSIDTNSSTINCISAGNSTFVPNNFMMVQDFEIDYINGDYISYDSTINCLQNLEIIFSINV